MDTVPSRREAWSRYWRGGALHSLSGTLPDDLRGGVGEFWTQAFSPLSAGDRVLDIGTGNGVLPALLCRTAAEGAMPSVDAVDLADVGPAWIEDAPARCREAITFHPGVAAESLPFPDGHFDLVVSQYGLEYAAREPAMAEVARVLRQGGRLVVLMHHAGSHLAEVAREELSLSQWLCAPGGLLERGRAVLPYLALGLSPEGRARLARDPAANAARAACNDALQATAERIKQARAPDLLLEARTLLGGLFEAVARGGDPSSAQRRIDAWGADLQDAALRYRELCTAALDETGMEALAGLLRALGVGDVRYAPFSHENGRLIAWRLTAGK